MEQQKKPKYKIKEKLWQEWHGIVQVSNNKAGCDNITPALFVM